MTFKAGGVLSAVAGAIKLLNWLISIPTFRAPCRRAKVVVDPSMRYDRLPVPRRIFVPAQHLKNEPGLHVACIRLEAGPAPISLVEDLNRFIDREAFGKIQEITPELWPPLPIRSHATDFGAEPRGWRLFIFTREVVPSNQLYELISTFDTLENLSSVVDSRVERSARATRAWAIGALVSILAACLTSLAVRECLIPLIAGWYILGMVYIDVLFILEAQAKIRLLSARGL